VLCCGVSYLEIQYFFIILFSFKMVLLLSSNSVLFNAKFAQKKTFQGSKIQLDEINLELSLFLQVPYQMLFFHPIAY
jgi:hypothetical protein